MQRLCAACAAAAQLVALGMILSSIIVPEWYVILEVHSARSTTVRLGLNEHCRDDVCSANKFADVNACARRGDEMHSRFRAIFGLAVADAILVTGGAVASLLSCCRRASAASTLSIIASLVCAVTQGCGVALFVYTIENWYFCGQTYCEFSGASACSARFGVSFYLAASSIAVCFMGFVLQLLSHAKRGQRSRGDSREPVEDSVGVDKVDQADDDWVLDESTGLYWSEAEQLYYDGASGQYFDPHSQQWFDPATGLWTS